MAAQGTPGSQQQGASDPGDDPGSSRAIPPGAAQLQQLQGALAYAAIMPWQQPAGGFPRVEDSRGFWMSNVVVPIISVCKLPKLWVGWTQASVSDDSFIKASTSSCRPHKPACTCSILGVRMKPSE